MTSYLGEFSVGHGGLQVPQNISHPQQRHEVKVHGIGRFGHVECVIGDKSKGHGRHSGQKTQHTPFRDRRLLLRRERRRLHQEREREKKREREREREIMKWKHVWVWVICR